MPHSLTALKSGPLHGTVRVPSDKSISHRALIFGALAIGQTKISHLLEAEDIFATADALKTLGAHIEHKEGTWIVTGCGVGGLTSPQKLSDQNKLSENKPSENTHLHSAPVELYFGNSGTGSRLMMGVVAGHDIVARFNGDDSLCKRPMKRVLTPLKDMGLNIIEDGKDTLPLTLQGSSSLLPITYKLPVASAQVKSAIILAALMTEGQTTIIEPALTRDHTERMLSYFGANISVIPLESGRTITVHGPAQLSGQDVTVPADPSSAAFLAAAALICPGSDITLQNVLTNPTRFGFYQTLLEMGANIELQNERTEGGEPIADLHIRSGPLQGVSIPGERAPTMIDEYPCLSIVAAFADGETHMQGLSELRVKESDRLNATAVGLQASQIPHRIVGDDLIVQGQKQVLGGGTIQTEMDHRIAMSFLTLGLATENPVTVDDSSMIATSFPQFTDLMQKIGARFKN